MVDRFPPKEKTAEVCTNPLWYKSAYTNVVYLYT